MNNVLKIILFCIAIALVITGVLGIFLPFLQGILLILIGLFLLSYISPSFKVKFHKARSRFPKLHSKLLIFEEKIEKFISKIFKR